MVRPVNCDWAAATTLPPVLEDTRDLLLCIYMVLVDEVSDGPAEDGLLRLGWKDVALDAPARWLADLIWSDIVPKSQPSTAPSILARVINSFEWP